MAEPAQPIFRSVDEFLAWENAQAERYEFVGGVITMLAGGTENHDLIGVNATSLLHQRLQGSPCRAHGSNLKVRSPAGRRHVSRCLRAVRSHCRRPDRHRGPGPCRGGAVAADPAGRISPPASVGPTRRSNVAGDPVRGRGRGARGGLPCGCRRDMAVAPHRRARAGRPARGLWEWSCPWPTCSPARRSRLPTYEFDVDGTGRAHARSARGAAHRLGLSRLPRPAGGGDPARAGRRRGAGADADRRRQVALLPGAGLVPGRAHGRGLAADRADAGPGRGPAPAGRAGGRRSTRRWTSAPPPPSSGRCARARWIWSTWRRSGCRRRASSSCCERCRPRPVRHRRGALRVAMGPRLPPRLSRAQGAARAVPATCRAWR